MLRHAPNIVLLELSVHCGSTALPLPDENSFSLLELADRWSGKPNAVAREPVLTRLLAALWRGEFEAFSPKPYKPCREATLRALQFCDAVPDFPEENLELEYKRLSGLKYENYGEVGQAILNAIDFPRMVIAGWVTSLQNSELSLDKTLLQEPSYQPTTGQGRRPKHDYDEIDELLTDLFKNKGKKGFLSTGEVVIFLRVEIGQEGLPSDSTLRSHIKSWLMKRSINP